MTHAGKRLGMDRAKVGPCSYRGLTRRHALQALSASLLAVVASADAEERSSVRAKDLPLTGEFYAGWEPLDEFLTQFMWEHDVPGAAIAIMQDERLVYARGLGRTHRDAPRPVLPTSRFRIASISKPLTAIAVARFVERGALQWDTSVCDVLARHPALGSDMAKPRDGRWKDVTVRYLLQHRGGWDRRQSFDPMFRAVEIALAQGSSPPANAVDIVRYMLKVPLDFDPGIRAAYSNFGYCLLGRILEAITGQPYEDVIREEVLLPAGARRAMLGKTRERADFEVDYDTDEGWGYSVFSDELGKPVPGPRGAWYLEAMDSHGGWIASALDLVQVSSALHRDASPLLSEATRRTMFERPDGDAGWQDNQTPRDTYFGCGWMVRPVEKGFNCWHTGSLPGTSTILVRRWDNMHWAVLFNRRRGRDGRPLAQIIDPLLHPLIRRSEDR